MGESTDLGLLATEELNRRIIEAMPGGIVHVLADGTIRTANAEALRILGLSYDALTHKYTVDFETQTIWEDGTRCAVEDYPVTRALVTGEPQPRATIGVRRPDGTIAWAIFTAVPVKHPATGAVTGAVVTFLDITDRKHAETAMRESDRLASVGTLAAGVAHEINNPLTYVMAHLDRVRAGLARGDASGLDDRVAQAIEGCERIRRIVGALGTFSRAADDRAVPLNVHDVIESALRMAANELRFRATLVRAFAPVPPVMADPGRLAQVVLNLIVNAIHAMPDGDVAGNELRIATSAAAGRVRIAVSDTGPGIAPAVAAHLFEPFVTSKPPGIGTGLGLYISRNIVLAMNGSLTVDSVPGRGATFLVELPAAATAAPEPSAPRAVARRPLPPARILVVDDERAIRELMRDALAGHQVETAASGREAIAALEQSPFDLVFCDLIMPDLTGMDVYEHARASAPSGPAQFVFMTGAAFTAAARAFLRDTSRPVLHKPFDEAAIVDTVERALTRSP